ncbi:MAG: thymidylate kinase [Chloroflexi bacterium]|nr:thymidylate kinase [Chloroflexota bacterium]MCI0575256.1 thymidylate kinase [Chloroflexota bacterium]MCI0645702.1 thymidylate kinase [Chloroflexota bacterium]MCI0731233.1 thymidylate kinase [Chloroflexota bacterium]
MFMVALIGADGSGKTTIARRLESELPHTIKYIYMGFSPLSSNVALPTTRLISLVKRLLGKGSDMSGPPDPARVRPRPKNPIKRLAAGLKASLRLANRLAEEWFRQGVVWYYQRRGFIVLSDRHFFSDYYAYDVANNAPHRPLTSRIHGFVLGHLYPRPDLVIFLDAPAQVLLSRKGEGNIELLERRRQEYLRLRDEVRRFVTVNAEQPLNKVMADVLAAIGEFQGLWRATAAVVSNEQ